jgi:hypothetical protein
LLLRRDRGGRPPRQRSHGCRCRRRRRRLLAGRPVLALHEPTTTTSSCLSLSLSPILVCCAAGHGNRAVANYLLGGSICIGDFVGAGGMITSFGWDNHKIARAGAVDGTTVWKQGRPNLLGPPAKLASRARTGRCYPEWTTTAQIMPLLMLRMCLINIAPVYYLSRITTQQLCSQPESQSLLLKSF